MVGIAASAIVLAKGGRVMISESCVSYEEVRPWLRSDSSNLSHLLLGNGFSIAYDVDKFSYNALRSQAENRDLIGPIGLHIFQHLGTNDFEAVIKVMQDASLALRVINYEMYQDEIDQLEGEIAKLKEGLATILAGIHPERPYEIDPETYLNVRNFLDDFKNIYTANYDLLLYWALMQGVGDGAIRRRASDDGFRDPKGGAACDYVLWDYLSPHNQNVYYIHGALHLYRASDGLRKLTWKRPQEPLIDQIRRQLRNDSYPLYVAEGSSAEKLHRIHSSDYLAKALRSLAGVGGGLLVYGLSFSENDQHIMDAIVRSKVKRMAVSIFGDIGSSPNQATRAAVHRLQERKKEENPKHPVEVRFFDSASVKIWN